MTALVSKALRNSSGAAAIEFAIVFPVFLLLTLGMIAYGLYFGAAHSAAQLAADAARASIAGITDQERSDLVKRHVARSASVYALIDPDFVTATSAPVASDVTSYRVTVRYDAKSLPIWRIAGFLPLPSRIIERSAIVKRGGY